MQPVFRRRGGGTLLLVGVVAALLLASCSSSATKALPLATYHANSSRTGYSTTTSITPANASRLSQTWHITVPAPLSDQVVVDDGVLYWGDWAGNMHATDRSGTSVWSTNLGTASKPKACPFKLATQGIVSSATVGTVDGQNLVWVGGGAGQLVALNASTGAVVWSTQLGASPEHVTWTSPAVYNGSVYEGVASFNDCPVVNGEFDRVNALTGAVQAVNHLSQASNCVGPGIWSSPAVDPSNNSVYVSTSNANLRSNLSATCESPDQEAVLQLDATTLAVKSAWSVPKSQQAADSDFGASPMLFTGTVGGKSTPLVGLENKNGVYYAFDRDDLAAGPVWEYVAEDSAALNSAACEDLNTISTSAWAGQGAPVMVAGIAKSGSSCTGTLAALNPNTGLPEWIEPLQSPVLGAVTEVPGLVAVGAGSYVDVLSSADGAKVFSYHESISSNYLNGYGAPVGWFWAPPAIAGNSLYAGNQDGTLRSFSL
ncbi:MAG: PQQ-binding-like beta-propeller repeat protein [Acidimicrobiales bacterium]|jgi:polyvinyl alcohol dehydrogenase (cytochrome)